MGILLLGEMNMLRPDAGRSTTVMPVEECRALVLTKDAYEDLGQRDPLLGYIFTRNIAQKIVGDLVAMNARVLKLTQALSIALDKRR
jgi:CRP-like cAMP-binding protein